MRTTTTTAKFIAAHPDGVPTNVIVDESPAGVVAAIHDSGLMVIIYHGAHFKTFLQPDDTHTFDTDNAPSRREAQQARAEAEARHHGLRI